MPPWRRQTPNRRKRLPEMRCVRALPINQLMPAAGRHELKALLYGLFRFAIEFRDESWHLPRIAHLLEVAAEALEDGGQPAETTAPEADERPFDARRHVGRLHMRQQAVGVADQPADGGGRGVR